MTNMTTEVELKENLINLINCIDVKRDGINNYKSEKREIMNEKYNYYYERTFKHIHLVQKNALFLITKCQEELKLSDEECCEFMTNISEHDLSKFIDETRSGYADFSWVKKNNTEMTPETKEAFDKAWRLHYRIENHHPEKHKGGTDRFDRLEIIEIVCDLQAMADEFGEGSCRGYFENVWIKNQSQYFSDDYYWSEVQLEMLKVIDCFEKEVRILNNKYNNKS